MTEYPEELVERVRSNREDYTRLLGTGEQFTQELGTTTVHYENARNELNFRERVGGRALKLFRKSTPRLQVVWDAEDEIKRLEGLLGENSAKKSALYKNTNSMITSYLAGASELFQEYVAGRTSAARAVGESEGYLALIKGTKEDIDYIVWMVWRDWPGLRDPWRRPYPPRPRPPRDWDDDLRIMDTEGMGLGDDMGALGGYAESGMGIWIEGDAQTGESGDEEIGTALYDPEVPDFSKRRPPRDYPPRRRPWQDYWLRRQLALNEAQGNINRIQAQKPDYVSLLEQYTVEREKSQHLTDLPSQWYPSHGVIRSSYVGELPWYTALSPLAFVMEMDRVSGQLTPLLENIRRVKVVLEDDFSTLERMMTLEVSRVKEDILTE